MTRALASVVLVVASGAGADLLGVGLGGSLRPYYRISTSDGSVALLASYQGQGELYTITLGPDGWHYAHDWAHVQRVDPFTGYSEDLHRFGDTGPTGAFAARDDGILLEGWWRYSGCYLQGWNVYEDEYQGGYALGDGNFCATAGQIRSDGEIVLTRWGDPVLYTLDTATHELVAVGSLGIELDAVMDFATDPRSGLSYMVVLRPDDSITLWRVDLETAACEMVSDLTEQGIYGISAITGCLADFDEDGSLSVLDFVALQLAWQAGDEAADVNGDGVLDVLDFVAFQEMFQAGCR